ncbi:hypothetical protein BJ322DRAFT_1003326 [Thelephora terrestris]|uniref:C2H2-type domain-containing protein n=1 Tax=Thelephora terrestris TaxID=56493 RepID=A0A9P6L7U0_9AGAM|nr:hypothetical protein BJ322DRAFT_1003326 [Thelephora terrestris]
MSAASSSSPPPESTGAETTPQPTTSEAASPKQQPSPVSNPSQEPVLICLWVDCGKSYPDPEILYNHLCNDHIGRKSTNNLCLTCRWKDCGATCAKRDHITSHLRVHTPLKPHICEICKKSFKRPQDLKKHEKIHTEEHHAQHKHSKAITVTDPEYSTRVKAETRPSNRPASKSLHSSDPAKPWNQRAKSNSATSEVASATSYNVLPTPSPELDEAAFARDLFGNHGPPTWDAPRHTHPVSAGTKRSHDYMEEFLTDMKKRRLTPSYDPHMAERLSNLAYLSHPASSNQHHGASTGNGYGHTSLFNPRSVSFDIHTPEELAAVNEFLITLGREVTTTTRAHPFPPRHSAREFDNHPGHSYFNPAGLSELGLAGMPGIANPAAGSGSSFSDAAMYPTSAANGFPSYPSRSTHQPATVQGMNFAAPQPTSLFPDAHIFFPDPTPRRDNNAFASPVSTPSSLSDPKLESPPPFPGRVVGYQSPETLSPHSTLSTPPTGADFDFLRTSRGPPPVAQLTRHDYHSARTMIPVLKTLPSDHQNHTESASSKLLKSAPTDSGPGSDSLHHLLTSGSEECTLPPLHLRERPSSPSTLSSRSGSFTPEPQYHGTVLPSLKSVTSGISTERLASSVRDIEIESQVDEEDETRSTIAEDTVNESDDNEEQRQAHAQLIKDMLIYINSEYKKRYGIPGEKSKNRFAGPRTLMGPGVPGIQRSTSSMDVEMTVV